MTKLLVVETSPRGDSSISRNMTRRFVAHWQAAHPGSEIVERDLAKTGLAFITAPWLQAYFTPPGQQSAEMKEALRLSDELVPNCWPLTKSSSPPRSTTTTGQRQLELPGDCPRKPLRSDFGHRRSDDN